MQFSYSNHAHERKVGKFALIAGIHVAVGVLFVHSLNTRHLSLPALPQQVLVMLDPEPPAPPPPPAPPEPVLSSPPQQIVVPPIPIDVAPPPDPSPLRATTTVPEPQPAAPTPSVANPQPQPGVPANANANANAAQIRTAVFADANGCALPAYPPNAARNGDTGTTTLALLVGADGRVSSARVEHTSGSRELDRAAVQALSLCTFKPATTNGVAESGWARLAYVWTLD